jgi:hypothetical protein
MRGPTSAELRTERFQNLTFLGLVADDVSLALMHYPTLNASESQAVIELTKSLDPSSDGAPITIRHRKSMGNSSVILQEAAEVSAETSTSDDVRKILADLRSRLQKVSDGSASADDIEVLHEFSERLANITLIMTEDFASERGARDWMPKASDSFVAL